MKHDDLGTRMKEQYENRTRYFLPRRTYTIMRLDGKAFHTFTKDMERPYDFELMNIMDRTSKFLCENIQGAQFAYTQSDEISLLLTDFEKITTDAWFGNNIQKMVSVAASIATAKFNAAFNYDKDPSKHKMAFFDARVFTISDIVEVENYFIWRQKDAVRNSIAMTAQSLYSHKELNGKSSNQQLNMIHEKGENWNEMPNGFKRGRLVKYDYVYNEKAAQDFLKRNPAPENPDVEYQSDLEDASTPGSWEIVPAYDFLKDRKDLQAMIPKLF